MDSNAIVDYLSGNITADRLSLIRSAINAIPQISVIAKIEVLSKDGGVTYNSLMENFVNDCYVSSEVVNASIALRRKYRIKTPDAIIAATALCYDLVLITADTNGFSNIKGLKLLNQREEQR